MAVIPNTESQKLIQGLASIKTPLTQAGIILPDDFKEAVRSASVTPAVQTYHEVQAARIRLGDARTDNELHDAARELAQAEALRQAATSPAFVDALENNRFTRLLGSIGDNAPAWFAQLSESYNKEAPTFEAASNAIPDLRNVAAIDVGRDVANAIADARESAGRLNVYWNAYFALGRIVADFEPLKGSSDWSDFREVVLLICEATSWARVNQASHALHAANWGADDVELKPLYPHIVGPRYGFKLNLASNPGIAKERQDALMGLPGSGMSGIGTESGLTGWTEPHFS